MKRKMIRIDEDKCIGCGLCVMACEHGLIEIVNGKAKIQRHDYCVEEGKCMPVCPRGAISFVEKEIE